MNRISVNVQTGIQTIIPITPAETDTFNSARDPVAVAAEASAIVKAAAVKRISEIRLYLIDKLTDAKAGTPAEQATANAALGLLRAELALEKIKAA